MRWWSVANFVSNAGTWMQLTVQNLLVLQITGSAAAAGLSMSVQAAPALLMSVLGGAAVDRWPRKVTAAVSQALLALIAFTTAVLVALDRLDMTSLMVLAAVTGEGGRIQLGRDSEGRVIVTNLPPTLPTFFDAFCALNGAVEAVVAEGERLTFAALNE